MNEYKMEYLAKTYENALFSLYVRGKLSLAGYTEKYALRK